MTLRIRCCSRSTQLGLVIVVRGKACSRYARDVGPERREKGRATEVKPPATKEKADETPDDEFAHALDDAEMPLGRPLEADLGRGGSVRARWSTWRTRGAEDTPKWGASPDVKLEPRLEVVKNARLFLLLTLRMCGFGCEVFWKSSGSRYVKAVRSQLDPLLSPEIKVKCIKISIPRASGLEFGRSS